MLRLLVLLLLLANGAFYAWSQGLLGAWGLAPQQQSEPQRLRQQIRPEALRIASADEAGRIDTVAAAPRAAECLQAGPLDEAQAARVRAGLEALPPGSWVLEPTLEPARWIVYMGRYPDLANVNRKKAELRYIGVSFEPLSNPTLEPGLSLGGFTNEAAANRYLDDLAQRGVRTARVVVERAEQRGVVLRLPAVDDALRPRLEDLRTILGRSLRPCR